MPFGGAIKYFEKATPQLDRLNFEQQAVGQPNALGIDRDLRGYLRGSAVSSFMQWFRRGAGRESDSECLRRELREELADVGLPGLAPVVESLDFVVVREVSELPVLAEQTSCWQIRVLRVYDLEPTNLSGISLREQLLREVKANSRLALASADDIRHGTVRDGTGTRMIGQQSSYLFNNHPVRPNQPVS